MAELRKRILSGRNVDWEGVLRKEEGCIKAAPHNRPQHHKAAINVIHELISGRQIK